MKSVSGLSVSIRPFEVYEGGNNLYRYAQPDKVTWDPVTLEQGLAIGTKLREWAEDVVGFALSGKVTRGAIKRLVHIAVFDEANNERLRYQLVNAWISKYQAVPKLDALSGEAGIVSLELTHEGYRVVQLTPRDKDPEGP